MLARIDLRKLAKSFHFALPCLLVRQGVRNLDSKFIFRHIEIYLYIGIIEVDALVVRIMPISAEKGKGDGILQKECVYVQQLYLQQTVVYVVILAYALFLGKSRDNVSHTQQQPRIL